MGKRWLRKSLVQVLLIVVSVILGMLFFIQIEIDSDMSGAIVQLYKQNMYLGEEFQWANITSYTPWNIARWISYSIFGISEDGVKCIVTIFFMVCCFIMLELGIDDYEKDGLIAVPIMFFMLIPGIATNKYHQTSTIVALLVLLYLKKRIGISSKMRRISDMVGGIIFAWLLFVTSDKMLIFLNVFCPIFLYYIYISIRDKRNLDKVYLSGLVIITMFFTWFLYSLGHPDAAVHLYGAGSGYLSWADFSEMWSVGIEFLIKTVVRAMNISASGEIVQPMTLVWMIKILLIIFSIAALVKIIKRILKDTTSDIRVIYWVIICGAVLLSILLYLMNGVRIGQYKTYGYSYSYCGYMAVLWFLIPLLAAEYVKWYVKKAENHARLLKISIWVGCGMLSVMSMVECISVLTDNYQNINKQVADYLVEIGAEGGVATYEASYATTVWSEGKVYSVGYVNIDVDEESKWAYRRFDTYIEWKTNNKGPDVSEQNVDNMLLEEYGVWTEKKRFRENETRTYQSEYPQERFVYFYNRDIRWNTREIDAPSLNSMLIYLPLGQNRVQLIGSGLANVELQFVDASGKIYECEKEYISDTLVSYLVMCPYNGNVEVHISNAQEQVSLERLYCDMNRAAVCLGQDICIAKNESINIQTDLPSGEYVFILVGENLRNVDLISLDESSELEVYQNGKGRKIFICNVNEDRPVMAIINRGKELIDIENIYYELTYEERSALIEELNSEND